MQKLILEHLTVEYHFWNMTVVFFFTNELLEALMLAICGGDFQSLFL